MQTFETAICRRELETARRRTHAPELPQRWRAFFAEKDFLQSYDECDLRNDLGIEQDNLVTAVTGVPRVTLMHNPGRGKCAWGGDGHRIETAAYALVLLWRLGAIAAPWDVLEPLRKRLRKREWLTSHELHVLWGERERDGPAIFSWQEGSPLVGVSVPSFPRGECAILEFCRHDGRLAELAIPPRSRMTKEDIRSAYDTGLTNYNAAGLRNLAKMSGQGMH